MAQGVLLKYVYTVDLVDQGAHFLREARNRFAIATARAVFLMLLLQLPLLLLLLILLQVLLCLESSRILVEKGKYVVDSHPNRDFFSDVLEILHKCWVMRW